MIRLILSAVLIIVIGATVWFVRPWQGGGKLLAAPQSPVAQVPSEAIPVRTVAPSRGEMDRICEQPGSIQSYETASLVAGVPGYLKSQTVDIGDRVKQGQVLAIVDVPDLEKQVQRNVAMVEQCQARVGQMRSRVNSAKADVEVAEAEVARADATAKSKAAEKRFRQQQLTRMKELLNLKSVDERLVDEKTEQRDAAEEAENAAKSAVVAAKAHVTAAQAKIQQAEADLREADAEVKVAQADLEKSKVMVGYATIRAPFDGVITQRTMSPGDYVRAPSGGGSPIPLLTIERTDRMRVVVQIPDRDVPFVDPGDPAEIEIDSLPGKRIKASVTRSAGSVDMQSRVMRVEIDLPNPTGKICQGMYGRVRINLERSELLSVPSPCLMRSPDGKTSVFVVRDGHARKVDVHVAPDNGVRIGIISGLKIEDRVILRPPADLVDGSVVHAEEDNSKR